MKMKIFLTITFTNPNTDEKVIDWILLDLGQWLSYSPWVGSKPSGNIKDVNWLFGPKEIYLKEGEKVIGLVRGIASEDIMIDIGDTGTGKLYSGGIRYPVPINFNWESVPVPQPLPGRMGVSK
jgi:hypothetical protein